jgi:hypothetical protein
MAASRTIGKSAARLGRHDIHFYVARPDTLGEVPTNPLAINRDWAHGRTAEGLSATLTLDYFRIEEEVTVGARRASALECHSMSRKNS